MILGLEYPPIDQLVEWPGFFNKIAFIHLLSVILPSILFLFAMKQKGLVPRGARNFTEIVIEFVEKQVILPAIGPDGMRYLPLLLSFFLFVFFGSIFEVIPAFNMPAHARMAGPLVLALVSMAMFIGVGIKHNGVGPYFKSVLFPSGVPGALFILVTPIELISTFLVRPFSHAVRLFANMLAGKILLTTFAVMCIGLWAAQASAIVIGLTFPALVLFTAFEIGVSLIQAFVFTILAAVYIGGALHPHH